MGTTAKFLKSDPMFTTKNLIASSFFLVCTLAVLPRAHHWGMDKQTWDKKFPHSPETGPHSWQHYAGTIKNMSIDDLKTEIPNVAQSLVENYPEESARGVFIGLFQGNLERAQNSDEKKPEKFSNGGLGNIFDDARQIFDQAQARKLFEQAQARKIFDQARIRKMNFQECKKEYKKQFGKVPRFPNLRDLRIALLGRLK